jgi:hypothetical protein
VPTAQHLTQRRAAFGTFIGRHRASSLMPTANGGMNDDYNNLLMLKVSMRSTSIPATFTMETLWVF